MSFIVKLILDYILSKIPGIVKSILNSYKLKIFKSKTDKVAKEIDEAKTDSDINDSFDRLP